MQHTVLVMSNIDIFVHQLLEVFISMIIQCFMHLFFFLLYCGNISFSNRDLGHTLRISALLGTCWKSETTALPRKQNLPLIKSSDHYYAKRRSGLWLYLSFIYRHQKMHFNYKSADLMNGIVIAESWRIIPFWEQHGFWHPWSPWIFFPPPDYTKQETELLNFYLTQSRMTKSG